MTDSSRPKPDRIWLYVGVAFVAFWGVYLTFFAPGPLTRKAMLQKSGTLLEADYSWKLLDLDGKEVSLSQYRGKTVFLNIWATWCPPCVQELPSIARLATNPKLGNVVFLCVSSDESPDTVKRFLNGKGWTMTMLRATSCPAVFQTDGIPATFLIGPDGKIAASEVGSAEWDAPDVVELLEKLDRTSKSS